MSSQTCLFVWHSSAQWENSFSITTVDMWIFGIILIWSSSSSFTCLLAWYLHIICEKKGSSLDVNVPRKAQHRDFTSLLKGRGAQVVHVRDLLIEVSHQGLRPLTLACRNPQILQQNPLKNSISRPLKYLRTWDMWLYFVCISIYIYIDMSHTVFAPWDQRCRQET